MKLSIVTPTHDPRWLSATWRSLRDQPGEWEWLISVNSQPGAASALARLYELASQVRAIVENDPRVRVIIDAAAYSGVGQRKSTAFRAGTGDVLVELDHDDLLAPGALAVLAAAFEDPAVGFCYSDWCDFDGTRDVGQGTFTYRSADVRPGWIASGFDFYNAELGGVRPGAYECVRARPPTARALSHVYTAPNHVRAWRRTVYQEIGGHNPAFVVGDDHDLLCRTYLATRMKHIPEPLYLYRITGENTWSSRVDEIRTTSNAIRSEYLERLVLRECELLDVPAFDLGGAIDPRSGWKVADVGAGPRVDVVVDLRARWPWPDGSVGAFRAADLLEHLPDKLHTMSELHRCLRPGGWLLSSTPSTDGRGAFQDPTHVSYWNENAFWYWTRPALRRYIANTSVCFDEVQLFTWFPSQWHADARISYVQASLMKVGPR